MQSCSLIVRSAGFKSPTKALFFFRWPQWPGYLGHLLAQKGRKNEWMDKRTKKGKLIFTLKLSTGHKSKLRGSATLQKGCKKAELNENKTKHILPRDLHIPN